MTFSITERDGARFMALVAEQGEGCWPWGGYKTPLGYGKFSLGGRVG